MPGEGCRIDELVLRLRGVAPDDARRLADTITQRLAERQRGTRHVASLREVHVEVPAGLGPDALVDAIVSQIARQAR